jgi:hypothetical protein
MGFRAAHYRRRAQQVMASRPGDNPRVTYRRISRLDGPTPAQNPPRYSGPLTVAGPHEAGAATLALAGAGLVGRVVAGDRFTVGLRTFTAAAEALDTGLGTVTVPLTEPLAAPLSGGSTAAPAWSADTVLWCRKRAYGERLIDGQQILAGDHRVEIAAADLAFDPTAQDLVIMPNGDVTVVVAAIPTEMDGEAVTWALQTR